MLVSTEHLIPGMRLDKDIELKAGSYLITRRDLSDGVLTEKVIESIQKFSHQIVPIENRIFIADDKFALEYIRTVLGSDLQRIAREVSSGKLYPDFLAQSEIQVKVMRVMELLFSNPDIIRVVYNAKFNSSPAKSPVDLIIDHSFRVTLLSLALGLKMGWSIIALMSLGTAALIHDMGIFTTDPYPNLEKLDEMSESELTGFVKAHQSEGCSLFERQEVAMSDYHKMEIAHIVDNHHCPNLDDTAHRSTVIFYFCDLLDEMISHLPHGVRYNFTPGQLSVLGKRFSRRVGLVELLSGLARLYRNNGGFSWEIISNLAQLFRMMELLKPDFGEKLQKIIDWCPFDSAAATPAPDGNFSPHSIYCRRSLEEDFYCEHLLFVKVQVHAAGGGTVEHLKCGALGPRLQKLLEQDEV
ncbi:MAG: HD domain-containing protein [Candidatus Glassbacteria bacterium]